MRKPCATLSPSRLSACGQRERTLAQQQPSGVVTLTLQQQQARIAIGDVTRED